jgi:YidC/Oxa1 family membrane protein insertase
LNEFHNPSQEPGTEKRLLIAFALIFLIIAISQQWLSKNTPPQPVNPPKQAEQQQPQPQTQAPPAAATQAPEKTTAAPAEKPAAKPEAPATPPKQAQSEQQIVVENGFYRITLSNRGALATSWVLKKHEDEKGKPLDLVNQEAAKQYGYPLSLFTYDEGLRNKINSALFVPSQSGTINAPTTLNFEYSDGQTVVRKSFHFDHSYVVQVETSVQQNGAAVQAFPAWPSGFGDQVSAPGYASARIEWFHENDIERQAAKKVSGGNTVSGPFYWAGVTDQYFGAMFLPDDPANAVMVEMHQTIPQNPKETDPKKRAKDTYPVLGAAVGDKSGTTKLRLFVGPKNLEVLNAVNAYLPGDQPGKPSGPTLEATVDFGFFGIIAKPLFLWLRWTYEHWVPNWGWAIVVLTIIINAVLFPLRLSSMKSALLQQKVQPEVMAINRRYQGLKLTDPKQQEKQKEIQAVYKREGINPIGGCVPMLLQIPFLYAFYAMLASATELRHAHWLWISDLSAKDPLYILPIGIIVSMYIMQKITPMSGMNPQQAKMMQTMMPLMIGFISWALPAGLCVYWVTGNIFGYAQQKIVNNMRFAREIREHLEKRNRRK